MTKYRNTNNAERLVDAQLAWISFRDRNCKFASERFQGGSIAPMIYSNCIERLTKQRTDELERYFKGMESRDGL
ncbi:lysozyme inhibitor LprI family protein [Tumidithrix elongata RA019]|uniref:Lysozyme inhibitor LprI family protein n=1 Tax=Tumidithrix elongata BACA0141 TaxID=2716417 RepID=A0AAW9Q443_9CYAN|nr:lysozyme inhibitor LprI family protein [Tumidithrix elongata RA019]